MTIFGVKYLKRGASVFCEIGFIFFLIIIHQPPIVFECDILLYLVIKKLSKIAFVRVFLTLKPYISIGWGKILKFGILY